jgi:tetratricopeptide (TPR) repeat protein
VVEFSSPAAARLFFANCSCSGRDRLAVAERGFSLRYTDPVAMLAWCEAAAVNPSPLIPPNEAGLLAAYLANAHRVTGNFCEADNYFRQALAAAPAEPLVLHFYATFMKETGQLDTAAEFLRRAGTARYGVGDQGILVISLMEFAVILSESGLPERAAESVRGALDILGLMPATDERERLARVGFQNLAKCLVDAGKPLDALWILKLCRERLMQGGEFFCLRLDWLMADISGALGDIENAVESYKEVRERYAALGNLRETALVTLDLARLLLKPKPLQAREEALSVWPILDGLGIARDAREAKLLAEVVEKGSEAALIGLAAALRALARATRTSPTVTRRI